MFYPREREREREVTKVSWGQKEKMCGDWLMCRQSSDIDIKIQSGNLNSSTALTKPALKSSLNFILERHKHNCKISYKWQEGWKSSPKQKNVAKIAIRWWWLNVEELFSVCQLGPRVRFPWPLIVLEIFYAIFFTEIAPTLTRHQLLEREEWGPNFSRFYWSRDWVSLLSSVDWRCLNTNHVRATFANKIF